MPEINNKIGKFRTGSWFTRTANKVKIITVHHSAIPQGRYSSKNDLLKAIQNIHEGHGWPGLSYHHVIHKDGTIDQLNELTEVTWHDGVNWDSIGILVEGYFHKDNVMKKPDKPSKKQLESLEWLLDKLCTETPEIPADHDDVLAHRERSATACPGDILYPYVKEYREKRGSVKWVEPEDKKDSMETRELMEKAEYYDQVRNIIEVEDKFSVVSSTLRSWKKLPTEFKNKETNYLKLLADKDLKITQLEKEVKNMAAKVQTDPNKPIKETLKELLRIVAVALIPASLAFLETIPAEWAITLAIALRALDKFLHEYGKATNSETLIKGVTRF